MKEFNEKMKKEYTAPQMEVLDCAVQGSLLEGSGGDVILDDSSNNN
jgi:hypothetical protein